MAVMCPHLSTRQSLSCRLVSKKTLLTGFGAQSPSALRRLKIRQTFKSVQNLFGLAAVFCGLFCSGSVPGLGLQRFRCSVGDPPGRLKMCELWRRCSDCIAGHAMSHAAVSVAIAAMSPVGRGMVVVVGVWCAAPPPPGWC